MVPLQESFDAETIFCFLNFSKGVDSGVWLEEKMPALRIENEFIVKDVAKNGVRKQEIRLK